MPLADGSQTPALRTGFSHKGREQDKRGNDSQQATHTAGQPLTPEPGRWVTRAASTSSAAGGPATSPATLHYRTLWEAKGPSKNQRQYFKDFWKLLCIFFEYDFSGSHLWM